MTESNGNSRQHSLIRLHILSLGEDTRICELRPDSNLIVGSGRNCGLRLAGPGVSPIHAAFRRHAEQLWLQPWHGNAAMYVNGERIEDEVQLAPGDEVQIGTHRLVVDHREAPDQATSANMSEGGQLPTAVQAEVPFPAATQSSLSPPACVGAESASLDTHADDPLPDTSPHDIGLDDFSELYADDCPEGETIRLLQEEIALLQSELDRMDSLGHPLLLEVHPYNTGTDDDKFAAFEEFLDYAIERNARFITIAELVDWTGQQQASGTTDGDQEPNGDSGCSCD